MRRRPSLRLMASMATVLLLASACGASEGVGELLPFADVQASEFVFEADPSDPSRGVFRMQTTEPMICAIVWGETEAFGNFNNSLAMNGTGIIDHDVSLPGAEQGRTYFFQVQGSTADGKQYRSKTGTFTIPVIESSGGESTEARGENLSLQATLVEASSEFSSGWSGSNAIDADMSTEWATKGDGDDGFITIDLGSAKSVAGTEFITRRMLDGTAITDTYTITVDGGDVLGPFAAGTPADANFNATEFTGQVIRFDIESSTGGNVGAIEINVFAPMG